MPGQSFFSDIARECDGVYREGLAYPLRTNVLKEASGLAVSRKHPAVFWSHDDGSPQSLYAFTTNPGQEGLLVSSLTLPDYIRPAAGGDFEDISSAECPDGSKRLCLWIADVGDNQASRDSYFVYAMVEPKVNPVVTFLNEDDDAGESETTFEEEPSMSVGGRRLLQQAGRALQQTGSYLQWIVFEARNGHMSSDAHERYSKARDHPEHYDV